MSAVEKAKALMCQYLTITNTEEINAGLELCSKYKITEALLNSIYSRDFEVANTGKTYAGVIMTGFTKSPEFASHMIKLYASNSDLKIEPKLSREKNVKELGRRTACEVDLAFVKDFDTDVPYNALIALILFGGYYNFGDPGFLFGPNGAAGRKLLNYLACWNKSQYSIAFRLLLNEKKNFKMENNEKNQVVVAAQGQSTPDENTNRLVESLELNLSESRPPILYSPSDPGMRGVKWVQSPEQSPQKSPVIESSGELQTEPKGGQKRHVQRKTKVVAQENSIPTQRVLRPRAAAKKKN